mmetsp:Transcript_3161/g.6574  ORF Transcript_3161/g.6574 Transcript_3161/m.6574 type:complete len:333 (-) Transcript_3161:32-1030(-)|eukprot:CAMPEP_0170390932 /NCGR_PEP_ID=MMETSP0117_2-20130122/19408_1 /TAXON_ID=400756 /ORGANISM="Durinskia baltica, Strain CSIRO CS-38" /LENGTH=332 /DNA_ID=CAMNT_0010647007 /DNA_START=50 /DNA_END=1048 /DNA_ORIENTATION=-
MDELQFDVNEEFHDNDDFCRGYGAQTNEDFDDPDDEEMLMPVFNESEENDTAPEMPQNFYKEVENFLMRAPPSIKVPGKVKSSKKQGGVVLPDINTRVAGPAQPPQPPQVTSKVRSKLLSNANKPVPHRNFDHNLLREAFAYTDMLLKEALIEEASQAGSGNGTDTNMEYQQPQGKGKKMGGVGGGAQPKSTMSRSRTAPVESIYMAPHSNATAHPSSAPARKKNNPGAPYQTSGSSKGVVKKLRSKVPSEASSTSGRAESGDFHISNDKDADTGKRNPVNFDELISNFQGGVMLNKLRKELEESQQSMKKSENFMRQLSQEYFNKGKKTKG